MFKQKSVRYYASAQVCVQDILRCIIIEAAVEIFDEVADKRLIGGEQSIHNIHILFPGDTENEPFIYVTDIPVARNRVSGIRKVVKASCGDAG